MMESINAFLTNESSPFSFEMKKLFIFNSKFDENEKTMTIQKVANLVTTILSEKIDNKIKGILFLSLSCFFFNAGCEQESNEIKEAALILISGNEKSKRTIDQQIKLIDFLKELNLTVKQLLDENKINDDYYSFTKNPSFLFCTLVSEYNRLSNLCLNLKSEGSSILDTNIDQYLRSTCNLLFSALK